MGPKKFLIPVAAALTALTSTPSSASLPVKIENVSSNPITLGNLVLDNATQPIMQTAAHASHSSHASHASHASSSS